jgi:hypothetical protein
MSGTSKTSITWKHHSLPPAKEFKTMPSVRNILATVFKDHKDVFFVDFFDHGNTVTAEH